MLTQNGIDFICQNFGNNSFCCVNGGLSWYYTYNGQDYPETGATAQIVSRFTLGIIDSLTMVNPSRGTFTQAQLNAANGAPVTLEDAKEITHHDEPSEDQWCFISGGCSTHSTEAECLANGCYWYNNSCHDNPPPQECSDFTTYATCIAMGCYWWDNSCHAYPEPQPPVCSDYTNQTDCVNNGCYWWDNACHDEQEPTPPTCESYATQSACVSAGCYWYNGSCHSYPEGEEIDWLPYFAIGTVGAVAIALILSKRGGKK